MRFLLSFRGLSFIFAGLLVTSGTHAESDLEPIAGSFKEQLTSSTVLAGDLLVAVMKGTSRFPKDHHSIHIFAPASSHDTTVYLSIKTFDGRYNGSAEYQLQSRSSGSSISLIYPTNADKTLFGYGPEEVLCLAIIQRDDSSDISSVLPCSWSDTPSDEKVRVYLNSSSLADGTSIAVDARQGSASEPKSIKPERVSHSNILDNLVKLDPVKSDGTTVHVRRISAGTISDEVTFIVFDR